MGKLLVNAHALVTTYKYYKLNDNVEQQNYRSKT